MNHPVDNKIFIIQKWSIILICRVNTWSSSICYYMLLWQLSAYWPIASRIWTEVHAYVIDRTHIARDKGRTPFLFVLKYVTELTPRVPSASFFQDKAGIRTSLPPLRATPMRKGHESNSLSWQKCGAVFNRLTSTWVSKDVV